MHHLDIRNYLLAQRLFLAKVDVISCQQPLSRLYLELFKKKAQRIMVHSAAFQTSGQEVNLVQECVSCCRKWVKMKARCSWFLSGCAHRWLWRSSDIWFASVIICLFVFFLEVCQIMQSVHFLYVAMKRAIWGDGWSGRERTTNALK